MDETWGYLELSVLIGPQGLPLGRVEELVWVDVVQELTLQRYVDPDVESDKVKKGNTRLESRRSPLMSGVTFPNICIMISAGDQKKYCTAP